MLLWEVVRKPSSRLMLARRRCLVCEAVQEMIEPRSTDEIGTPCRSCRAPTERIEVLAAVPKNPFAVALGRLGGLKGGRARAVTLTPQRRQEIARKAAAARWARSK